MRLALLILLALAPVATAQLAAIPCRNLKSEALCAADERAKSRDRAKAHADQATELRPPAGTVFVEKITIEANPEDLEAPEKPRWEKFEQSLQGEKVVEFPGNDGTRWMCLDPCKRKINCCVQSGGFNLTGKPAGR